MGTSSLLGKPLGLLFFFLKRTSGGSVFDNKKNTTMSAKRQAPKKRKFKRKYGRTGDHERKAVPIFDDETRRKLDENPRVGFVDTVIRNFDVKKVKPEDIVDEARVYFRKRYDRDIEKGVNRASHWLNSTSTALTHVKDRLKELRLAPYEYRREIAITKRELDLLDGLNYRRLEERVHEQPEVDLTRLLRELYAMLNSEDPEYIALGVAGLTGRRQTEVVYSIILSEPKQEISHRYPSFWAHVTGFSKRRKKDKYAVRSRELPLLAPREALMDAIREIRSHWPADSHEEASELYAHKLAAAAKEKLRPLGIKRMHDLRKAFVQIAYEHFNERGSVLPAFASNVLGHKSQLSKRIMTYLIIRTTNMPPLEDIFRHSKMRHLTPGRAENHDALVRPSVEDPQYDTPSESEEEEEEEKEHPPKPRAKPAPRRYHFDRKGRPVRRSAKDIASAMKDLRL